MRLLNRKRALIFGLIGVSITLVLSYLRVFVILGDSDAPALITGDRVLVNLAAYDICLPFTEQHVSTISDPKPGDLVVLRLPDSRVMVKRVVAGPGARIEMQDSHLTIDGHPLEYIPVEPQKQAGVVRGSIGGIIELERGNGPDIYISYGESRNDRADFTLQVVPDDSLFILGSNRDASLDSRQLGPIPRAWISGKVIARF